MVTNQNLTFIAGADLTAQQFRAVMLAGDGRVVLASLGAHAIGFLRDPESTGRAVSVTVGGIATAVYGATLTPGAQLACNAAGALIVAIAGQAVIATALENGVAGDIRPVLVRSFRVA